ncbi:hypothetical protein RJ641_020921 [Dillenia turbinata]|uniref:Uncharacterized protein n=1 Tax=Dillenia turbinata TaxID=194707 RepID=A0AAN8UDR8_9MAGN
MKKLRWAMDGDFWDVDVSTPRTLESVARPVPGDGECVLPLGLSRGCRLSRPNQIDFFQRFMAALFSSFAGGPDPSSAGFSLHRVLSLPFSDHCWEQSTSADPNLPRRKALLHHKALSSAVPTPRFDSGGSLAGTFVDKLGTYWDVPLSLAFDLGSVASTLAPATMSVYAIILGLRSSSKRTTNIWTSEAEKLKMVQPFDLFLSKPHVSASGIIGAVATASLGNKSVRSHAEDKSQGYAGFTFDTFSAIFADIFASVSLTAQHGNFQRLFLDLTRFHAPWIFPSGLRFLSGTSQVARNLYNSQQPKLETIAGMLPHTTLSLQQQIVGPFSFRVDSGVAVGMKGKKWHLKINEPVFAVEYALQVLGSAKAVAWYSPKHQELMVELRFYET